MRILSVLHLFAVVFFFTEIRGEESKTAQQRSFVIDRKSNSFLKDGIPFRYISGTIHYFRVRPEDWRDRLQKLRYSGCNAVDTYIQWSIHEPEPGNFTFDNDLDLFAFLTIAQQEDLLVILRPGPYIDAEIDLGGLPYWLLRENPNMQLRSSDPSYISYVDKWFKKLLPQLSELLYENGGPIIMIQVENEYGSSPTCDLSYTGHLRDLTRKILGDNVVLFTTDGPGISFLKCGKIADVYATVNFGTSSDIAPYFEAQRNFEPDGPLVNSEFYSGWLDHWGDPHTTESAERISTTLDAVLALNASVNIYVFHGGTSFGMSAGSNFDSRFKSCPTSYDYDAPLNEGGDPTEKYYAIRNVTRKYVDLPSGDVPPPRNKYPYGDIQMIAHASVLQLREILKSTINKWPLTFEALSAPNGLVSYTTMIPAMIPDPAKLSLKEIHDRGYIFIDNEYAGVVSRETETYDLPIFAQPNQMLTVVAESMGRICAGNQLKDFKGITTNVTIGSLTLENWEMTPFPFTDTTQLFDSLDLLRNKTLGLVKATPSGGMVYYRGAFNVPSDDSHPQDTFLRLGGWTKGYVWINDFLLGRYWPVVGPQVTLYIPHSLLKNGENSLLLLELEGAPCDYDSTCNATLVEDPEIDAQTPKW